MPTDLTATYLETEHTPNEPPDCDVAWFRLSGCSSRYPALTYAGTDREDEFGICRDGRLLNFEGHLLGAGPEAGPEASILRQLLTFRES